MKKELKQRIEKFCKDSEFPGEVYFSSSINDCRYKFDKYFFKFHNTHNVMKSFKSQKEIENFLEENNY